MGILPTVNVQQVVEQLPAIVQQGAMVEVSPKGTLPVIPDEIRDILEISSVSPVRPVGEPDGSVRKPEEEDDPGLPGRKKKKSRIPGGQPDKGGSLDVKA
ncbi:MAG: hypothetical protein ACYCYP_01630 [Leptospirales bacterium]